MWRIPIPSLHLTYPRPPPTTTSTSVYVSILFLVISVRWPKIHRNEIRCSVVFNARDVKNLKFIIINLLQIFHSILFCIQHWIFTKINISLFPNSISIVHVINFDIFFFFFLFCMILIHFFFFPFLWNLFHLTFLCILW